VGLWQKTPRLVFSWQRSLTYPLLHPPGNPPRKRDIHNNSSLGYAAILLKDKTMMTYCIYGLGFIVVVAGIIVLAAVILAGRNDHAHGRK
jgi:hypothetical protein